MAAARKAEENSFEEDLLHLHAAHLRQVLDRLAEQKWVVHPRKCKLFVKQVEFCGHLLGNGRLRPARGKMSAVQHWEPPPTVTAL